MSREDGKQNLATCLVVVVAIICLTFLAAFALEHGIDGFLLTGVSAAIASLAAGLAGFRLNSLFRK